MHQSLLDKRTAEEKNEGKSMHASKSYGAYVLFLFFLQIIFVGVYVILSYTLPYKVPYLTGNNAAIHVAAVHSLLFFVVAGIWMLIRAFDFSKVPERFPLNRNLAEMNAIISVIANALLLLCLGLEDWVKQQGDHYDFSVLGVVQWLGVAELAFVGISGAGCIWRSVAYLRGLEASTKGQSGAGLTSLNSYGGRKGFVQASDMPATPRPLPGGTALARLQEVGLSQTRPLGPADSRPRLQIIPKIIPPPASYRSESVN